MKEQFEMELKEDTRSQLNKFFMENNIRLCSIHLCLLLEDELFSYKVRPIIKGEPFLSNICFEILEQTNWNPPIPQKKLLLKEGNLEVVDIRIT